MAKKYSGSVHLSFETDEQGRVGTQVRYDVNDLTIRKQEALKKYFDRIKEIVNG